VARIFVVLALLIAPTVPVWAQNQEQAEQPDCSGWTIQGLHPGMTLKQASEIRVFNEFLKYRDPVGYRRYVWQNPDKPEKIELHVDSKVDAGRVLAVTATVPSADTTPQKFTSELFAQWGPPTDVSKQGAFNLYSWVNPGCDMAARVSVMNQQHDVGVFMSLTSLSGRDELARRRREHKAAEEAKAAAAEAQSD